MSDYHIYLRGNPLISKDYHHNQKGSNTAHNHNLAKVEGEPSNH